MKRPFLVVYDYGQGGVWAFLRARSDSEIKTKFPDLQVVERPPKWMSKKRVDQLHRTMEFDIDEPEGFLAKLLAKRAEGKRLRTRRARNA